MIKDGLQDLIDTNAILKNGGVYESTVFDPKEKIYLERYWIDLGD